METMYYKRVISSNQIFNISELDDDNLCKISNYELDSMVDRVAEYILDEISRQITIAKEEQHQKLDEKICSTIKSILRGNFN